MNADVPFHPTKNALNFVALLTVDVFAMKQGVTGGSTFCYFFFTLLSTMLTLWSTGESESGYCLEAWDQDLLKSNIMVKSCGSPLPVTDGAVFARLSFSKPSNPDSFLSNTLSQNTTTFASGSVSKFISFPIWAVSIKSCNITLVVRYFNSLLLNTIPTLESKKLEDAQRWAFCYAKPHTVFSSMINQWLYAYLM